MSIFTGAFIWKSTSDITLPLMFSVNGMLLLFLIAIYLIPNHAVAIAATTCGVVGLGITGYSLRKRTLQNPQQQEP